MAPLLASGGGEAGDCRAADVTLLILGDTGAAAGWRRNSRGWWRRRCGLDISERLRSGGRANRDIGGAVVGEGSAGAEGVRGRWLAVSTGSWLRAGTRGGPGGPGCAGCPWPR